MKFLSKLDKSVGLWINSGTRHHLDDNFKQVFPSSSSDQNENRDECMVLVKNSKNNVLQLKGESCFDSQQSYGALCETYFGRHEKDIDYSCFKNIQTRVLEYRIHLGEKLDSKHVSCPMHVDKRLGNTCYKKTEEMLTWHEARGLFTISFCFHQLVLAYEPWHLHICSIIVIVCK